MELVNFDAMVLLTKLIRGYKYKQIGELFSLFDHHKLDCFEAAEVRYNQTLSSIITPPVVEYSGGQYILVQGNTRVLHGFKNGLTELRCVVVRNHTTPLPSPNRYKLKEVLIGGRTISIHDRYGSDIEKDYRNIEWATHHPDETLLGAKIQ